VQRYGSHAITHYFTASEIITKLEVYAVLQCLRKDGHWYCGSCTRLSWNTHKVGVAQKTYLCSMTHGFTCARDPGYFIYFGKAVPQQTPWWQNIIVDTLISIVGIRKRYCFGWKKLPLAQDHTNMPFLF